MVGGPLVSLALLASPSAADGGERIFLARSGPAASTSAGPWTCAPAMHQLTFGEVADGDPVPSPDGSRVAFHRLSSLGGCASVWMLDLATLEEIPASQDSDCPAGPYSPGTPTWSPDGLAFDRHVGNTPRTGRIWIAQIRPTVEEPYQCSPRLGPTWPPHGIAHMLELGGAVREHERKRLAVSGRF